VRLTDHKTIGLQYFAAATGFLLVGFLLMLLMRWQLAWPTSALPAVLTTLVGETNAPSGYMAPEFYNQLVAMHGTVMIFLAVVPLLTGAFGNYLVPLQIGARDMAFPRINAAGFWIFLAAGLLMLFGFFARGGAANSGWTAYPPLAVIAPRGQDYWLLGILLLGISAMLNSINVIATVVQLRAGTLRFMQLPFFVWSQLIAAVLLLLAFPSLQAAGLLQLLDRVAGTSFFLPSGLIVNGAPLEGVSGGGSALLWQHLFWFLGHPEVYVLILPAIGIVAEIIAHHTGRTLWGYRGMVASVLFIGVMSLVVWAHHMLLTGMGTTLGTFFQITTMIISVPSVVLITSLMLSLWGGPIRMTTAMLFALAFLPMFGVGGLTGLPLGLAASNEILHDTWYVVGHFHFVVAPGTLFAIFAGVYYWFPTVTGRALNHRAGLAHFWGSLITMTAVFLPMFTLGLRGVNRRLYDAGLQYAHAQGTLGIQAHMTWAAIALGVVQLPFLLNVILTLRRKTAAVEGDLNHHVAAIEHEGIPWTSTALPGTRTTNVRLGVWLFLASEAMFFGSLFAAYVLLRTGAAPWPATDWIDWPRTVALTALLAVATLCMRLALAAATPPAGEGSGRHERWLWIATAAAGLFCAVKLWDYVTVIGDGRRAADHLALASWFVLTGTHWLHVAGGVCATIWAARSAALTPEHRRERIGAVQLYWMFVDVVWIAILVAFWL
jgi:cytochrome c oxidase subunit 1